MEPTRSTRFFIEEEKKAINKEIQKAAHPITDKEISTIISNLHERYAVQILPAELQPFISKYQSTLKLKIQEMVVEQRQAESIFFKQFAEVPKVEQVKKQRGQERRAYVNRSKRKIKPTEPNSSKSIEEFVQYLDNNTNQCHMILQPKNRKNNTQKDSVGILHQNCQLIFNEQFYSILDRPYFKEDNLFKKILQEIRMNPEGMTYEDYRLLKLALPQPKLFNSEFINSQIEKLNDYRNQVRSAPKNRSKGEELSVGREVIAVHPVCGHLHSGSILAIYKQNQYMVKFVKPELGTQKVLDINIALKELNHPHKIIIENVNYEAMALTIKLLEYKADLIRMLAKYNDIAQQAQKDSNSLDNRFFQQYGWIGSTINILSLGIKHILSKFRIRGLDAANQQKIGKNFASVLLNPLNLMEKELDKSSQNSDVNASNQIKRIIYNYKQVKNSIQQSKVDQYTKDLFNKYWNDIDIHPDQRQEFQLLIRSLVGILVSLKIQHKNFNIEQNKYLKELMTHFDNRFPEHFNQIYELLTSITSKLNEDQK